MFIFGCACRIYNSFSEKKNRKSSRNKYTKSDNDGGETGAEVEGDENSDETVAETNGETGTCDSEADDNDDSTSKKSDYLHLNTNIVHIINNTEERERQ